MPPVLLGGSHWHQNLLDETAGIDYCQHLVEAPKQLSMRRKVGDS